MIFDRMKNDVYSHSLSENIQHVLSGEVRYLADVFCVFGEDHQPSWLIAAQFLCMQLNKLSFHEVVKIDVQMREKTSMGWLIDWTKREPEAFLSPKMSEEEKKAVLVFASFHPNGYLREKAVRLLPEYPMSLPYLLLRMNDWTRQVREAAQKAFYYRLEHLADGELLASLPFAKKLSRGCRTFHHIDLERLYQVLCNPQNKKEWERGLDSDDPHTRALCVDALLSDKQADLMYIFAYLKKEKVPHLRLITNKKLLTYEGTDQEEVLQYMLTDRYARIRHLALTFMEQHCVEHVDEVAINFLLDKNEAVRSKARRLVAKGEPTYDFRAYYRNALKNKPREAISGLGETGVKGDRALIEPFLCDDSERIVRSAMKALMRLDADRFAGQMVRMLDDHRTGIVKEAYLQLRSSKSYAFMNEIHEIYQSTESAYSRKKCAMLLFCCSKWQAIIYMLEAVSDKDEKIAAYAKVKIAMWIAKFNRSFTTPSEKQQVMIRNLIEVHEGELGRKTAGLLRFLVR